MLKRRTRGATRLARLDRAQEKELATRACAQGDLKARNRLVLSHLFLVRQMAGFYAQRGASYTDLVQEGSLALMRAAQTFDPSREARFATFAVYWVRSHMQRYLAQLRGQQFSAPASVAFAGGRTRGKKGKVHLVPTQSLSAPLAEGADATLQDMLPSGQSSPLEQLERDEAHRLIRAALVRALQELDDRRLQLLVERRYLSDRPSSFGELSRELHLSREGARLLEQRLLRKVREAYLARAA